MTKPFAIESFPMDRSGHWIVVPSEDREEVEIRMDLGGGVGPLVAEAEWIATRGDNAPGFLCWRFLEDVTDASFATPTWIPTTVVRAVQTMAFQLYAWRQEHPGADA